ncbi:MAG: flagellar motor switch protein FliN, partial [Jatrophihabitans sp.]
MTETTSPSQLAQAAAEAALANLPISEPLQVGAATDDLAQLQFDGVAVTARFTGARSGEVLITVERALVEALQNSPLGALDVAAALAPALAAAANTTGTVLTGPGTSLDPRTALEALLGKPGAWVVPLLHGGTVRALIGLVIAVEPAATPLHDTPHYPSPDELRASVVQRPGPVGGRRGVDLLGGVKPEMDAWSGGNRA